MKIKYTIILILAALFLSNCSNMQETVQIQTATPVPPTLTPTITLTPTETLIPTPTPVVISTFDRQDKEISGQYTETQMNLIESGLFSEDENQLQNWFEYWMKFINCPFDPESLNLQYKYVFDSTDPTGQSAGVLLENLETGKTFYLPIKNGQYMTIPPELPKSEAELTDVPEGFGPLELSGGEHVLAWRDEGWVRIDTSGNIRETLNLDTAQWEATENYKDFSISNSVDASVDLDSINDMLVNKDNAFFDHSENGNVRISINGSVLSYIIDRKDGKTSFVVLYGTYQGAIKIDVDYIAPQISGLQTIMKVSDLSIDEINKIATKLDYKFTKATESKWFASAGVDTLKLKDVMDENGAESCLSGYIIDDLYMEEMVNEICRYDPSEEHFSSNEIKTKIEEYIISTGDMSLTELLSHSDNYEIFTSSGGSSVVLGIGTPGED